MRKQFAAVLLAVSAFASFNASAQTYPSRPTFLSAGVGCNPNLYANDLLTPGEIGFLCVGRYPYALGTQPGALYIIEPTAQQSAYIGTFVDSDGSAGLSLFDGNGIVSLTLDGDDQATTTQAGEWFLGSPFTGFLTYEPNTGAGAEASYFRLHGEGEDVGAQRVRFFLTTPNSSISVPSWVTDSDDSGTGALEFGTYMLQTDTQGDTALTFAYTESSGAFTAATLDAPTINLDGTALDVDMTSDFSGNMVLSGSANFTMTSGVISDSNGGVVIQDDASTTGGLNVGDDLTVTDTVTVNGLSDFNAAVNIDAVLTVDSCVGCAAAGAPYGGYVDAAAAAESLPTGWSASYSNPTYTITHNLGNADYAVTATFTGLNNPFRCQFATPARNANDFTVVAYSSTDTSYCANDFTFTLVIIDN